MDVDELDDVDGLDDKWMESAITRDVVSESVLCSVVVSRTKASA